MFKLHKRNSSHWMTRDSFACGQCGREVEILAPQGAEYLDNVAVLSHAKIHKAEFDALTLQLHAPAKLNDWSESQIDAGFALATGGRS
jgi:hypothetical protein